MATGRGMGNAIDQPTHGKVVLSDSRLGIVRDTPVGRIKYSDSGQLPIASPEAECAMNRHSEKILGLKLKHPPFAVGTEGSNGKHIPYT